ncbi:MAG TPA: hypothetical protein VG758_13800 [Hyphomicrobiaceae bacterium]|jgi:hypothetical protein|nr:hypothetical protein [Hyphomicrobiaceae bacterium]
MPTAKGASTERVTIPAVPVTGIAKGFPNTAPTSSTASGTSTTASADAATSSPMV